METTIILNTDGKGLWSNKSKPVIVTGINCMIGKVEDEDCFIGELMVRFDLASWDTDKDGLIYTDDLFRKQLHEFLISQGFTRETTTDVSYSEQGMQSDEYVSLDVSSEFCQEWLDKYPDTEVHEY
jgi:hypothetical protein